jgi:transposase
VFYRREFRSRQKGGESIGKTKRGKGTKWMVVVDGAGVPLGSQLLEASPAEVTLVEHTLNGVARRHRRKIRRLIADRAYDSDGLRRHLRAQRIELISPHRKGRKKKAQDGRALRRYRHRWKIERTFAWLGNFRRLVVRYERDPQIYEAFFHIACALISLRHL